MFDYSEAFSRNLGWLSDLDQAQLKGKRVAIAGAGGVGGIHLVTLARLGIGAFHIADFDTYELANFNRQYGAKMSTIGKNKADVMAAEVRDIDPDADIKIFGEINESNIDAFLEGVDLYIDGLDVFVLHLREKLFAALEAKGIPAITAAPLGASSAYIVFKPGGMSFRNYFCLHEAQDNTERMVRFMAALAPERLQGMPKDMGWVHVPSQRVPSLVTGCQLAAAVASAEALKILTGTGKVWAAPYYHQFDAFTGRYVRGKLPFGNAGPLQRFKIKMISKILRGPDTGVRPKDVPDLNAPQVMQVLDFARWTPNGDNTQPWKFKVTSDRSVMVYPEIDQGNIYEYRQGQPVYYMLGCLLETMRLAASKFKWGLNWQLVAAAGGKWHLQVDFHDAPDIREHELTRFIKPRFTDRRPFSKRLLNAEQKAKLAACAQGDVQIDWYEGARKRDLVFLNARGLDLRLRMKRCFDVHQQVIDWERRYSRDKIPSTALGASPLTQKLMRFAMGSWQRIMFMNTYMMGTLTPRIEMDVMPGLCSAAFFVLRTPKLMGLPVGSMEWAKQAIEVGMVWQRFLLTATSMGLSTQPNMNAPICATFGAQIDPSLKARYAAFLEHYAHVLPADTAMVGRIGYPPKGISKSRSVRKPLSELLVKD